MLRAGTFRLMFQRVSDLSIAFFLLPVPQYPVIQDRKAAFVLVVDRSGLLWQSDHVVLERYTSNVV